MVAHRGPMRHYRPSAETAALITEWHLICWSDDSGDDDDDDDADARVYSVLFSLFTAVRYTLSSPSCLPSFENHSTDHAEQRRPPRHSREHKQPRARVGTSWTHRPHRPRSPTTITTTSCRLVQGWAGAAPTVRCVDAGCLLRTALRASAYTCLRLTRAKPEVIAWRQREVSRYGWVAARAFIIVLPCTAVEIAL